jgi:hypothetical protein
MFIRMHALYCLQWMMLVVYTLNRPSALEVRDSLASLQCHEANTS